MLLGLPQYNQFLEPGWSPDRTAGSSCPLLGTHQVPKLPAVSHHSLAGKQSDSTNSHQLSEDSLFLESRPGNANGPLTVGFEPAQEVSGASSGRHVQDRLREKRRKGSITMLSPPASHGPADGGLTHCSIPSPDSSLPSPGFLACTHQ